MHHMTTFTFRDSKSGDTATVDARSLNEAKYRLFGDRMGATWTIWECRDGHEVFYHYTVGGDCVKGPRPATVALDNMRDAARQLILEALDEVGRSTAGMPVTPGWTDRELPDLFRSLDAHLDRMLARAGVAAR